MSLDGLFATASGSTAAPDVSITHLLLQMVVAMVLVVGGIWGFGKLMGRSRTAGRNAGRAAGGFLRSRAGSRGRQEGLTILSRQPVGKGKYLAVVQVGSQQFLVGIGDTGLTPLGELHAADPDPVTADDPVTAADPVSAGGPVAALARPVAGAPDDFCPLDLAAMDLSALGVRPLDLSASPVRVGGTRPRPVAARRPLAGVAATRQAPPAGRPAQGATARQQPKSVRSLVESLREATVRR